MTAPLLAAIIASAIAGHPTKVSCDADTNLSPAGPGEAWTYIGGNEIHMRPEACEGLSREPGSLAFARGLRVLLHESEHARGIRAEDCAELEGTMAVPSVVMDYYHVPFYKEGYGSVWFIWRQAMAETDLRPSLKASGTTCQEEVR